MNKKFLSILLILSLLVIMVPVSAADDSYDKNEVNSIYAATTLDTLAASSAILVEAKTGQVLYAKNQDTRIPIASMTKVMTTYLVLEAIKSGSISYETIVTCGENAHGVEGSSVYLNIGEEFTVRDLLYAIEIRSANDAAVALAEAVAGSQDAFVNLMNAKATELGMYDTYYRDCTGLTDAGHYSTVKDISIIACALVRDYPEVYEFTKTLEKSFRDESHRDYQYMVNRNNLLNYYSKATGLKTGFTTAAGYCLIGSAESGDISLIAVVTGEPNNNSRVAEAAYLLDNGFQNYMYTSTGDDGQMAGTIEVKKGVKKTVETYAKGTLTFFMKKSDTALITKETVFDVVTLEAPVTAETVVGKVVYKLNGEVIGEIPVLTSTSMEKAGFWALLWRSVLSWFGIDWKE